MDDKTHIELEAAAFRRLVAHFRERTDVQNIDMMNLAGFCRNCLSRWYREEAEQRSIPLSDPEAREIVYGMPYDEWRELAPLRQADDAVVIDSSQLDLEQVVHAMLARVLRQAARGEAGEPKS